MPFDDDDDRAEALLGDMTNGSSTDDRDPCGYYAALGVPISASQTTIRRAFLNLGQSYHTDKHAGETEEVLHLMNERFQQLQEAYSVLSHETQRAAYDASGKLGVDRLALVPQGVSRMEDIVQYLNTLEREAELRGIAKMLSATSDIQLNFFLANLFASKGAEMRSEANDLPETVSETNGTSDVKGETESGDHPPNPPTPPQTDADGETGAKPSPINAQLGVREVVLEGTKRLVLLPPPELENQLRRQAGLLRPDENKALVPSSPSWRLGMGLLEAVVPRDVSFRHSFQHQFTPKLTAVLQTNASQSTGGKSVVRFTGQLGYDADNLRSYAASVRLSPKGTHAIVQHRRVLSAVWVLRSKFSLLDIVRQLHKYELILERSLSKAWRLKNKFVLSSSSSGSFATTLSQSLNNGAFRFLSTTIGHHTLETTFFNRTVIKRESSDSNVELGEGKQLPWGFAEQTVSVSPLTWRTTISLGVTRVISRQQRVGVGFSTILPYTLSPLTKPPFIVHSHESAAVNSLFLSYIRGDHRITIPIVAFISPNMQRAMLWISAPFVLYKVTGILLRPYKRARIAAKCRQMRIEHQTELDIARARAMCEQKALETPAMRNRLMEERIGGLVVINAKYGVLHPQFPESLSALPSSPSISSPLSNETAKASTAAHTLRGWLSSCWPLSRRGSAEKRFAQTRLGGNAASEESVASVLVMDVTVPLQNFVMDSQLVLPEGTKSRLVGFADPDPYSPEQKQLKIVYWFQRRRHVVVLNDNDPVELPRREHLAEAKTS